MIPRRSILLSSLALGFVLITVLAYQRGWTDPTIRRVVDRLGLAPGHEARENLVHAPADRGPRPTPDGRLVVPADQQAAIGLGTAVVRAQTEPIRIELLGTTAYDPDTLTRVRPRFDALVSRVDVALGHPVKQGDPLVVLYSASLAEAKTDYQTAETRWRHDRRLLGTREPLANEGAISRQVWADTQSAEIQSRLAYMVARDKLLVYGLTAEQIAEIASEDGTAKAELTIRSPTAGIVINRDAVPGNLYGPENVLLTIAQLDHLWVWGNVYESDLGLVRAGLSWEVQFPYRAESVPGRVEYIADSVDPETRAVRIRGTIANPDRRFKADMLVRTLLDVPPTEGYVEIPRIALVVADGASHVYVRGPDHVDDFEQRTVTVAREQASRVVIAAGLRPGEVVVTTGSLLLAEIFGRIGPAQTSGPAPAGPRGVLQSQPPARAPRAAGHRRLRPAAPCRMPPHLDGVPLVRAAQGGDDPTPARHRMPGSWSPLSRAGEYLPNADLDLRPSARRCGMTPRRARSRSRTRRPGI
ncbi:efflux RND transporter periplasmic adaptor subunit [Paludisphaera sp.]|uniref:efflux RND transporter periplasmic adaptor subunit n=1 Tax=Paludisphaera sp. TaxID=2017432 RepID=UPI00301C3EAB